MTRKAQWALGEEDRRGLWTLSQLLLSVLGASQDRGHRAGEVWLDTLSSVHSYHLDFEVTETFCETKSYLSATAVLKLADGVQSGGLCPALASPGPLWATPNPAFSPTSHSSAEKADVHVGLGEVTERQRWQKSGSAVSWSPPQGDQSSLPSAVWRREAGSVS